MADIEGEPGDAPFDAPFNDKLWPVWVQQEISRSPALSTNRPVRFRQPHNFEPATAHRKLSTALVHALAWVAAAVVLLGMSVVLSR